MIETVFPIAGSLEPSFPRYRLGQQGSGSKPSTRPIRIARPQFDEPQDDLAVALAGPAHGPHAADSRRFDLDEAFVPIVLQRPP
jgi:hypothetical protein